jgi:hypothetical protein
MAGFSQAQLDAIKKAFASGITSVSFDGNTTTYRSLAEMQTIITTIESDLAGQSGKKRPIAGFASFRRS